MFTHKFAANRSVIRTLVWGWQKDELPMFDVKFRSSADGTLSDVVSKFSSDIHILVVADDAVDDSTRSILRKGYYSEADAFYFVEGRTVMAEFGLNGHAQDDNRKNILVYGFEDRLPPEFVPIYRQTTAGSFRDVLANPDFTYTVAVALESRPYTDEIHGVENLTEVTEDGEKRLMVLDEATRDYLRQRALPIDGAAGFRYFVLPPGIIREMIGKPDIEKETRAEK